MICKNCGQKIDVGQQSPTSAKLADFGGACYECHSPICLDCLPNCSTPHGTICQACQRPEHFEENTLWKK